MSVATQQRPGESLGERWKERRARHTRHKKIDKKYRVTTRDRPEMLVWMIVAAHVGTLIIGAIYFLVTQVKYSVDGHTIIYLKPYWDNLPHYLGFHAYPWWTWLRHDFRDVYEGLLAGLLVQAVTVNPLKWKHSDPGFWTNTLHFPTRDQKKRVTALQFVLSPLSVSLAGLPGFLLGIGFLVGLPALARHGIAIGGHSVWAAEGNLFLNKGVWQAKVIGFLSSYILAKWVFLKVAADTQLFFIERKVTRGKTPKRWWRIVYPINFRKRYQYVVDNGIECAEHGKWVSFLLPVVVTIGAALAVYGFWLFYFGPASHG